MGPSTVPGDGFDNTITRNSPPSGSWSATIGTVSVCLVDPGRKVTRRPPGGVGVKSRPAVAVPATAVKTAVEVTPVTGPVRTIGTCTMPVSGVLKMGAPKLMLVWISLTLIVVVEGVPSVHRCRGS